jgi:effector-binding domain-containing protein
VETEPEPTAKPLLFREARLPFGYPLPGPVREVVIKDYPASRAAIVRSVDLGGANSNGMFRPLFNHIKKNNIAMTAPVVMSYADGGDTADPSAMAFVYANTQLGRAGIDGKVSVEDLPAMTVASVGIRGSYTESHFREGLAQLRAWLAANQSQYEPSGPPRYLGYNSPFVPWFLRYGEVQIPVRQK